MTETISICDGCTGHGDFFHRFRADETSSVDGKDCPDYVEHCSCELCNKAIKNSE